MRVLNDPSVVPPIPDMRYADGRPASVDGQYVVYVPVTDTWLGCGDYGGLVEAFRKHLMANGLPVPGDIEGEVSRLICERVNPDWPGCGEPVPKANLVTLRQVRRWFDTMLAYAGDGELVPVEEAQRRQAICDQCRFRTDAKGCVGCGASLGQLLTKLITRRAVEDSRWACGVCGCSVSAMSQMPNDTLDQASSGLEYPRFTTTEDSGPACWRNDDKKA